MNVRRDFKAPRISQDTETRIRCPRHAENFLVTVLAAVAALVLFPPLPRADETPRSILMLEQSDGIGPFYVSIFSGFRTKLFEAGNEPVNLYVEHLDLSRFSGDAYEHSLANHLKSKYGGRPISVIVVFGSGALDFALRHRGELWPKVPIAFGFVDEASLEATTLPANVTGTTLRLRLADMVTAAEAAVPGLVHVAIVGDPLATQPSFRPFLEELPAVRAKYDVIDLTGLPMNELKQRVATLPDKTAVLYTAIYSDGRGTYFAPADALAQFASVANRPIIGSVESYVGRGAVGGYVVVAAAMGEEAGRAALDLLGGRAISTMPVVPGSPTRPVFDGRQLQRWTIDEDRLPKGSDIRFRARAVWEQYPSQTAGVAAVVLFQAALIAALLYQYRRRRRAEFEASARLNELAHVNRYAIAGEMSVSLAHQLNQPLGAILANAEAAEVLLHKPTPDLKEIKEILLDIKREDLRANGVIACLRRLLRKADPEMREVDLNQIVEEAFGLVAGQAQHAGVDLIPILAPLSLRVRGDAVQLQQVVLNLLVNAIEALRDVPIERRTIVGRTGLASPSRCELSVADSGPGIAERDLRHIFEPFYSSKPQGMGMGLSIARTIVDRHEGSISARNRETGGCLLSVELPLARPDKADA